MRAFRLGIFCLRCSSAQLNNRAHIHTSTVPCLCFQPCSEPKGLGLAPEASAAPGTTMDPSGEADIDLDPGRKIYLSHARLKGPDPSPPQVSTSPIPRGRPTLGLGRGSPIRPRKWWQGIKTVRQSSNHGVRDVASKFRLGRGLYNFAHTTVLHNRTTHKRTSTWFGRNRHIQIPDATLSKPHANYAFPPSPLPPRSLTGSSAERSLRPSMSSNTRQQPDDTSTPPSHLPHAWPTPAPAVGSGEAEPCITIKAQQVHGADRGGNALHGMTDSTAKQRYTGSAGPLPSPAPFSTTADGGLGGNPRERFGSMLRRAGSGMLPTSVVPLPGLAKTSSAGSEGDDWGPSPEVSEQDLMYPEIVVEASTGISQKPPAAAEHMANTTASDVASTDVSNAAALLPPTPPAPAAPVSAKTQALIQPRRTGGAAFKMAASGAFSEFVTFAPRPRSTSCSGGALQHPADFQPGQQSQVQQMLQSQGHQQKLQSQVALGAGVGDHAGALPLKPSPSGSIGTLLRSASGGIVGATACVGTGPPQRDASCLGGAEGLKPRFDQSSSMAALNVSYPPHAVASARSQSRGRATADQ